MSEHTPLPWTIGPYYALGASQRIVASNDATVCEVTGSKSFDENTDGYVEPDARFIVRACNSHDDLLAALEGIAEPKDGIDHQNHCHQQRKCARAAIAKAKLPA